MQFKEQFAHLRRGTYVPRIFGFKVHRESTEGAATSSSSSATAASQRKSSRSHRKSQQESNLSNTSSQSSSSSLESKLETCKAEVQQLRDSNLTYQAEINSLRLELEKSKRKKEKVENALGKVVTDMLVEAPAITDSLSKRKRRSSTGSSSSGKRQRKHERRSR